MLIFSILNHPCSFMVYYLFSVFSSFIDKYFQVSFHLKVNFVRDQENPKCHNWAPLSSYSGERRLLSQRIFHLKGALTLVGKFWRVNQIRPGLNANEIQSSYDKQHKVSSLVKSDQNTHNSFKYEVTWKCQLTVVNMKYSILDISGVHTYM